LINHKKYQRRRLKALKNANQSVYMAKESK